MIKQANAVEGVSLQKLQPGSVIDLDTKNHHYRIECLGGDKAKISGHPRLCPRPLVVQVQGSIGSSIEAGSIRQGMHLAFSPIRRSAVRHNFRDHRPPS